MKYKHSPQLLEKLVKESHSYAEVLRKLGHAAPSGWMYTLIKNRIVEHKLDTLHFTGYKTNFGDKSWNKKKPEEILISGYLRRPTTTQIRRALIEIGVEHKCSCGLRSKWNGKNLVLTIDHINGDWSDNRKENLRFLCPNCHSQTPTFGHKKRLPPNKCIDCNKEINRKSKRCTSCHCKHIANKNPKYKIDWPAINELLQMINSSNYEQVARKLGVSSNAIRKRLKIWAHRSTARTLPCHGKDRGSIPPCARHA